jgi:hypothetical protein
MNSQATKELEGHLIFDNLDYFIEFYDSLSFGVFSFASQGVKAVFNFDSYIFSSMKGTLDSIKTILTIGRINDAYALLRKFYDSVVINIYVDLYLQDNFKFENIIVEKINNWYEGKEDLPRIKQMDTYINNSISLKEINSFINKDDRYKKIRENCNDHVHYNKYSILLSNDNEIFYKERLKLVDQLLYDLKNIVILHLSYIFMINEHYMISSDYMDSLEMGMTPEPEAEYYVAPYIQEMFDILIKKERNDIVELLKSNINMRLE